MYKAFALLLATIPGMGNREALLAAAKRCLFEKGYERTTVRDLASAAGVSMAAIGYHFGSKEALLNQALFEALDAGDAIISKAVAAAVDPALDPEAAFEALWTELIESFADNQTFWMASIEASLRAMRDPQLRAQLADGQRQGRSGIAAVITGIPEAELPEHVVRTLGSVQLALMGGVMLQWLNDPEMAPTPAELMAGLKALAARAPG